MDEPNFEMMLTMADTYADDPLIRSLAGALRYLLGAREELRRTNSEWAYLHIAPDHRSPYGHGPQEPPPQECNPAINRRYMLRESTAQSLLARERLDGLMTKAAPENTHELGDLVAQLGEIEQMQDIEKTALHDHLMQRIDEGYRSSLFDLNVQQAEDKRMRDAGYRYDDFMQEWVKR